MGRYILDYFTVSRFLNTTDSGKLNQFFDLLAENYSEIIDKHLEGKHFGEDVGNLDFEINKLQKLCNEYNNKYYLDLKSLNFFKKHSKKNSNSKFIEKVEKYNKKVYAYYLDQIKEEKKEEIRVYNKTNPLYATNLLKKVNLGFTLFLILLCGYIFLTPLLPEVQYEVGKITNNEEENWQKYDTQFARSEFSDRSDDWATRDLSPRPGSNVLFIPKINVDAEITEGDDANALNKGMWRRPNTSTPENGGNTVITGHRFMYNAGPKTFYHLDKLEVGDKFVVFWEGEEYYYEIFDTLVVNPDQVEIETNTDDSIVTLYTCTPLGTSKNRLVVKGRLINES